MMNKIESNKIKLNKISDEQLTKSLENLCQNEQQVLSQILQHLCEIQRRSLVLKMGWPSLFEYCVKQLKFSESCAYKRILIAKYIGVYPQILHLLESGQTHLSNLVLVVAHLNVQNSRELFAASCKLRRRELEIFLAQKFPKNPVRVREKSELLGAAKVESGNILTPSNQKLLVPVKSGKASKESIENTELSNFPGEVKQSSQERLIYRLVLEADGATLERFEKIKKHLSTRFPKGLSKGHIVAISVEEYLNKLEKELENQSPKPKLEPGPKKLLEPSTSNSAVTLTKAPQKNSRYIPVQLERQVRARAQGQCEYESPSEQRRCQSQWNLHIHHIKPFAQGGSSLDPENLALFCAAHNLMQAKLDFPAST